MVEAVGFLVGTGLLAWVSRRSLRRPDTHGFYRFFAWECVLSLALLDARPWFRVPAAAHEWVAWVFLVVSLALVIESVRLLRVAGRPRQCPREEELLAFERTCELIRAGAYRYLRHPLYASLLFLAWGLFLKRPSRPGLALVLCATVLLLVTARREESESLRYFGDAYRVYMRGTKRFVPFLW